jgi:hypothetical protein
MIHFHKIMRAINCTLIFILSGCGATNPIVITEPVIVKTPVVAPCIVQYPAKPISRILYNQLSLYEKGVALMRDLEDQRAYSRQLEALLSKCASPASPPVAASAPS